jgi:hypothetical protein
MEFYVPFYIWDVILPIDELHNFSRWLVETTNQIMKLDDYLPSGKLTYLWKITIFHG